MAVVRFAKKDDDDASHREAEFEPHERAGLRDVLESFLFNRRVRRIAKSILGWSLSVVTLIGIFRTQIEALFK